MNVNDQSIKCIPLYIQDPKGILRVVLGQRFPEITQQTLLAIMRP